MSKTAIKTINKPKVIRKSLTLEEIEFRETEKYQKELSSCLKTITTFLKPIEEKWTGIGIPTLFSWLAARTGAGTIITSPMGAGKTLIVKLVDQLMEDSGFADYVISLQEFKKTDWISILPAHADQKFFHFSIPEISAMPAYSQEFFWSRIPAFQSEGDFEYRYKGDDGDDSGSIILENCNCSYAIASQPPKTAAIINDTTFRTLANDRCWNIILINQLRGKKNIHVREIPSVITKLRLGDGKYTEVVVKKTKQYSWLPIINNIRKTIKGKEVLFSKFDQTYVKFENTAVGFKNKARHVTDSNLDLSDLENCIRNQYSVDRRDEQINDILKQFALFLNVPLIKQVHVDLFVSLFGFYIGLFNSLTTGEVEQSISIKYGAVEMLCKVSALLSKNRVVTQSLLTKEFNAELEDISFHVSELIKADILSETRPVLARGRPKSLKGKTPRTIRRQANTLQSVGLLSKRRATRLDKTIDPSIRLREAVYEFTDGITSHFILYASILNDLLPKSVLKNIPHVSKFLSKKEVI